MAPRTDAAQQRTPPRERVAQAFTFAEDVVYLAMALALVGCLVALRKRHPGAVAERA